MAHADDAEQELESRQDRGEGPGKPTTFGEAMRKTSWHMLHEGNKLTATQDEFVVENSTETPTCEASPQTRSTL